MPTLSVIIPTFNRSASLQRVLAGVSRQTYPASDFEVVIVSDGSTDQTADILRAARTPFRLVAITQSNQGPAQARNRGVAAAGAEIIVFLDDDVVPAPTCLAEHARLHTGGEATIVLGSMVPPADFRLSPWVRWSQDRLAEQYGAMTQGRWEPTARQFYTGNASLPRHLLEMESFDAGLRRAEDVELAYRLAARGVRFVFNPQAIGYHYEERSFPAWLAIAHAYGCADVAFTFQKGQNWLLPMVLQELRSRPAATQAVTWACLDRPRRSRWMTQVLRQVAWLGDRLNWSVLLRLACSSLFNLYYCQGVADGLGGRQRFVAALAAERSGPARREGAPTL
jgi:glycosyltransferase involved in cell wall biosynthesis